MSDIKSEGFDMNGMHYGSTGAMNDTSFTPPGEKVKEMLLGAKTGFSGVGAGQQEPRSGS